MTGATRLCGMFFIVGNSNNTMKYIRIFAALTVLAFTLTPVFLAFNTSQAYAQNNTIPGGNQRAAAAALLMILLHGQIKAIREVYQDIREVFESSVTCS